MDDIFKALESGDKTIDSTVEGRQYQGDVRPDGWSERTEHRHNEIPSAPPYKAKVYNLTALNCEEFQAFLIEAGVSVVSVDEHNGYFVEVETPEDLALIISLDGEYFDEEHEPDVPPIKVRVLYSDMKHNNYVALSDLTRDKLMGAGAAGAGFIAMATRGEFGSNGLADLSRNNMGTNRDAQSQNAGAGTIKISRSTFSAQEAQQAQQLSLQFRSGGNQSAAGDPKDTGIFNRSAGNPIASSEINAKKVSFQQRLKNKQSNESNLSEMRMGRAAASIEAPTRPPQGKYQPKSALVGAASGAGPLYRKQISKKVVDDDGWTLNK